MVIRPIIVYMALVFLAPFGSAQGLTSTFDLGDTDGRDLEGLDNVMVMISPNETEPLESKPPEPLEPFYWRSTNATSNVSAHGGAGDVNSNSAILGKSISLYCGAKLQGNCWASGAVWDEFVYDNEDHLCRIALGSHVKGRMEVTSYFPDIPYFEYKPDNSGELKVYMILEDKTEDFVVDKVLIYSRAFNDTILLNEAIDESPTGEIEAELMKDHVYQLKLDASASSSVIAFSHAKVNFFESDANPEAHIKWSYGEVEWI